MCLQIWKNLKSSQNNIIILKLVEYAASTEYATITVK
jgi:hypothetical protein